MSSIRAEAERCMKCKVAMCSKNCPMSTPVPDVMNLFLEGKIHEAGEKLFLNNPLTAVTSVVCPHERNCFGHCVLNRKGEPIKFYEVEQYLSRFYLETFEPPEIKKNGINVAVVGGGPAGITMSFILLLRGYYVTMFEAQDEIGGVMRYGIPAFRLPKDYLDLYKKVLLKMGMKFRPNTRIGTNLTVDDLLIDGYKAVFVATGTGKPNRLGLRGETLGNVHFAIDYLKSPSTYNLGKKVVIVGAGNVAIDAARTAIRQEHCDVTILNFMAEEDMSADKMEVEMAKIDGAEFMHQTQAIRITDNKVTCVHVDKTVDEEGNANFEENYDEITNLEADSVIIAIGQGLGYDMKSGYDVTISGRGLFEVNEHGETSTPGVFAAGDIVSGARTVVEAVAFAKRVSKYLIEYCEGKQE